MTPAILVECDRPIAWLNEDVVTEALRLVDEQTEDWGPLRRQ